jgi:hypothetical protein
VFLTILADNARRALRHEDINPVQETNSETGAQLPCPARSLWQDPPPSLGSGIPGRIRSARPIPPRSSVTDLLPLRSPGIRIGKGGLHQAEWTAPDQGPSIILSTGPAAIILETAFPAVARASRTAPQVPAAADLAAWTGPDGAIPVVAGCDFSSSGQPILPSGGARRAVNFLVAPVQATWKLTNTFFTPMGRITQPEPSLRPLPAAESGSRPVAAPPVRPTRTAGIIDHAPWKLAEIGLPVVANCPQVINELEQQLARPRPARCLSPRAVCEDMVPGWRSAPNSYVRRIEIELPGGKAAWVSISRPLPLAAH